MNTKMSANVVNSVENANVPAKKKSRNVTDLCMPYSRERGHSSTGR